MSHNSLKLLFLCIGGVLCFLAGYYCALRSICSEFFYAQQGMVFADKVTAAFSNLYEQDLEGEYSPQGDEDDDEEEGDEGDSSEKTTEDAAPATSEQVKPAYAATKYRALLAGFRSRRSAEVYLQKFASGPIRCSLVERQHSGGGKKGEQITWYQVATEAMPYEKLSDFVAMVKKRDKLSGVVITEENV